MKMGQRLLPEWNWDVSIQGLQDPEKEQILAHDTREMLHLLSGAGFDLRSLDGVTIAEDYAKAVCEIDRGLNCRSLARPTNERGIEGVAMSVGVMRDGIQRTHLVLSARIPSLLRSKRVEEKRQAFGVLAHEAAHIHFAAKLESRIANAYGNASSLPQYPPSFQSAAMHIWDEYAATRMSGYIDPDATEVYRENIRSLITSRKATLAGAMMAYRKDGDYQRLFLDLSGFVEGLLCSFAYLLGHLDSLQQQLDVSSTVQMLAGVPRGSESLWMLQARLRALWSSQDSWSGMEVFLPLCDSVDALLRVCGVSVTGCAGNWSLQILESGSVWSESSVAWRLAHHAAYAAAGEQ